MKKITLVLIALCASHFCMAQYQDESDILPRNEVNLNIANTIAIASVELGYEYYVGYNQSVGVKFLINDRRNYRAEKHGSKFNTNSAALYYNFYFNREKAGAGFYVQPFMKYRFGNFKEKKDGRTVKTDMNAFMIGIGVGYKWNFSDSFVIGPFANIARNFSKEVQDRFSAFDFNAGLLIGYRF